MIIFLVRKHRAPKGALRLDDLIANTLDVFIGQKAPSAKRCIKTVPFVFPFLMAGCGLSESTERQKVH